jgi:hypothetical protein
LGNIKEVEKIYGGNHTMDVGNESHDLPTTDVGEWTIGWVGMLSSTKPKELTKLQKISYTSQGKIISIEDIFHDIINKHEHEKNMNRKKT